MRNEEGAPLTQQVHVTGYRFGDVYLDVRNRQLWRGSELVPLNSKYFDVLVLLVSHSGHLVEKRRIFSEIWDGVFVSDAALTQCVKEIRKQLQDDASNPRYVKTIPKHGYVFIGEVAEIHEEPARPPTAGVQPSRSARPYKFLDYYTEHDAALFFGRETEIEAICSQILSHRSFLLYGRSGVGKSSLLRAGLMPRLQGDGHLVFTVRSFTDPLHQMIQALTHIAFQVESEETGAALPDVAFEELIERIRGLVPHHAVVVMLDQFEEFFTLLEEPSQQGFIEAIGRLTAGDDSPLRFVFVLREDVLADMNRFKRVLPEIFHHEYRLNRLNRAQAARAITEPARTVGCVLEPALVDRLLDDLSEQNDVDPPHLQIVCDTLYDARDPDNRITTAVYDRLGGASQILAEYLTRVLRRFNAANLMAVQQILLALISADKQRLVLREAELESRVHGNGHHAATPLPVLVEELVAARVVRRRSQDGESWLELAHECLIPEVSGWLTANVYELKQARSLLERAVENYRAHQLILDPDSLDLLYTFLEQLGVTEEEADLLAMSLLNRGRPAPEWLLRRAPSALEIVIEAMRHADPAVRLCAIESSRPVRSPRVNTSLRTLALWDKALNIRKAASIELADWFGSAVEAVLFRGGDNERVGRIRRAISLAIVREYNNRLIQLPHLSLAVSVLVMTGLLLVRLRRSGMDIIRQGVGGTFGGAASGLIGGLLLGAGLSLARDTVAFEVSALIFVLSSLGTFVGAFGGAGVSFGMITVEQIAYRHSPWWTVGGGVLGGALVGGCANLLSVDALKTIFGQHPTGLTGGLEGALIGAGVALGPVVTSRLFSRRRPWHHILPILAGALGGMCAGILLTVIGGNLFSSSLEIVRQSFADSQIRLEPIAMFFGEGYFGRTTKIVLGAFEGFLFGGGVMTGIKVFTQTRMKEE
jgi:DNA-binding winged helix-turn-helix (wHTH) protein